MRRFLHLLVFIASALGAFEARAQVSTEPALKAAFLYKFAGYVEWPPTALISADAPFVIAVAGAEDVAAELERAVQGRTIHERRVEVRRLNATNGLRGVHVVFVGRGAPGARAILRSAEANGALTVTENDDGLAMGAAINFLHIDERIGFEVSLEAAERAGLRISSRMLAVARRVVPRPRTSGAFETELAFNASGARTSPG